MDTMVPKQAGFYGQPFKASRGVRQGDIISPMIFNIVTDAVIRESIRIFCNNDPVRYNMIESLFHSDDGIIIGENPNEVQKMLNIYTTTFARVGLKMNSEKTKAMIMNGGKIPPPLSISAYTRMMTGIGDTFQQKRKQITMCELCGNEVSMGALKTHYLTTKCKNGSKQYQESILENIGSHNDMNNELCIEIINQRNNDLLSNNDPVEISIPKAPETYRCSMDNESPTECPISSCPFHTIKRANMRAHFRNIHNKDYIHILEEGMLPKCLKCGIQQSNIGPKHVSSATCQEYATIKKERENDLQNKLTIASTIFEINGNKIETVSEFKYLGRQVTDNDCDWAAVNYNLKRARMAWGRLAKILSSEKAEPKAMATIYKAVIQAVLLHGSESWAMNWTVERRL